MRTASVIAMTSVVFLLLAPVLFFEVVPEEAAFVEDVLLFDAAPDRPVTLHLPARTQSVMLQTLIVRPSREKHLWRRRYPFGLHAALDNPEGGTHFHWTIQLDSRLPRRDGSARQRCVSRLRRGDEVLTYQRELVLPTAGLVRDQHTTLAVKPLPGLGSRLLFRAYALRAPPLEAPLHALTIPGRLRRRLATLGTGLGVADLPTAGLRRALATATVRLTAKGERDQDYRLTRVALSRCPPLSAGHSPRRVDLRPLAVGPARWVALAVEGPLDLSLKGRPGTKLRAINHWSSPRSQTLSAVLDRRGEADLILQDRGPRTVALYCPDEPGHVLISTSRASVQGQLPTTERAVMQNDRAWLFPDLRRTRWVTLAGDQTFLYRPERTEKRLRLRVRSCSPPGHPAWREEVRLEYVLQRGGVPSPRLPLTGVVEPSFFDAWATGDTASTAWQQELDLPSAVNVIQLSAPTCARMRLFTESPDRGQTRLASPYDEPLPTGRRWRFAPLAQTPWVAVRPSNVATLEREGGLVTLVHQTRIVTTVKRRRRRRRRQRTASPRRSRPQMELRPRSSPPATRLFVEQPWRPAESFPQNAWLALGQGRRIRHSSPRGRLTFFLQADPSALGGRARVWLNGTVAAEPQLVATSRYVTVAAPVGLHDVRVTGLGPGGRAFVDQPPQGRGTILRDRTFHEISADEGLWYRFALTPGPHTLRFQVVTDGLLRPWALLYRAMGSTIVRPPHRSPSAVLVDGLLRGLARGNRRAWLRDRPPGYRVGWSAQRLALPRVPRPTLVTVHLRASPRTVGPLWVRAILVGRAPPRPEERLRLSPARRP